MNPTTDSRLGPYRLVEKIGEGGMGVVWRAVDTTLDREVAIKLLPEAFADDPDRLARFEREAKLLASLSHPGIATIHGLHLVDGVRFLAMELVPGIDLGRRLTAGPIPIDETLGMALRVAEALEAAHDSGVVHRDLKPANLLLMPDGKVKILDFGLAKAFDSQASSDSSASMSPTLTTPAATRMGVILGTAAYMSPEQAKGKPVDRRADIWAFGCILYEMLSGHRPFRGDGVSELIAAVIMSPVDFHGLPPSVPPRVARLVRRCLEKDPRRRLRDIGEARCLLEEVLSGAADETPVAVGSPGTSSRKTGLAAIGAAALAAVATAGAYSLMAPDLARPTVRRFEIDAPGPFRSSLNARLVALSPDGRALAHVVGDKIHVRSMERLEPVVIAAQSEPATIFWSPDSVMIGYAAAGKLWKAPAGGGEGTLIADLRGALGGGSGVSWCGDGTIVVANGTGGLRRVPARGGDFEDYVPVDPATESDLHDAECLPDSSGVLFVAHPNGGRPNTLFLWAGGKRKVLVRLPPDQDIWFPVYSPTGHILYRRQPANAGIWALPFSLQRHEVTGEPFMVAPNADVPSVGRDGSLAHVKGAASLLTQLISVERGGKSPLPIGQPQEHWPFPELSPDGRQVAIAAKENDIDDIYIHDIERGTRTRLGASNVPYGNVAWVPGQPGLLYPEGGGTQLTMKVKSRDGSGEPRTIGTGWSASYSADGRFLLYASLEKDTNWDLFYTDTQGDAAPTALVRQPSIDLWPRTSPDGRYFAYVSDESGRDEVYLKRFPGAEGKWQVSTAGGNWPRWSRRGGRLYYVREDSIMELEVETGPEPRFGVPKVAVARRPLGRILIFGWPPGFDVSLQDDRFIFAQPVNQALDLSGVVVVENWHAEFTTPGE